MKIFDAESNPINTQQVNFLNLVPGPIPPGGTAEVDIGVPGVCDPVSTSQIADEVELELPGDPTPLALSGVELNLCNGLDVTPVGTEPDALPPSSDPFSAVSLQLTLPTTAEPGATINYGVKLTNSAATSLDLSQNCPSVTVTVFDGTNEQSEPGALPCSDGVIAPGASVDINGQVTLPDTTASTVKFSWTIDSPAHTSAGATVTLTSS